MGRLTAGGWTKEHSRLLRDALKEKISAGPYARCPAGHSRVELRSGQDALGKYLDAYCIECKAQERIRAPRSS
jgi:hypothetical protein